MRGISFFAVICAFLLAITIDHVNASSSSSRHLLHNPLRASAKIGQKCSSHYDCGTPIKYMLCDEHKCKRCDNKKDEDDHCSRADVCDTSNGYCVLTSLFKSFDKNIVFCSLAIFTGALIAAGGGLGGGGIFVPTYIVLLGLDSKAAAALSQATIFGGSIINMFFNFRENHPVRTKRPLTDIQTILILEPMLLGGTVVGVILNEMFPDWLLLTILELTLLISTYRTVRKGFQKFRAESEQMKQDQMKAETPIHTDFDQGLLSGVDTSISQRPPHDIRSPRYLKGDLLVQLELKEQEKCRPLGFVFVVWLVVSVFFLIRGGKSGSKSIVGLKNCSIPFWIVTFSIFPVLILLSAYLATRATSDYNQKIELGWEPAEGDIEWTTLGGIFYPCIAAIAGILGGMLGIGGGMIMSPLLIELGMLPRVASATSALAVAVTASSATVQFLLLSMLRYDYLAFFAGVGIVGTFVGQTAVDFAIKKYGRASIVIFAVATVLVLAVGLMGYNGVHNLLTDPDRGFKSVC